MLKIYKYRGRLYQFAPEDVPPGAAEVRKPEPEKKARPAQNKARKAAVK